MTSINRTKTSGEKQYCQDIQGSPLVSVILCNYNYGRFIAEAIDSVLKQTYTNFELIIVDDGSTDNSREIIAAYKDPRIHAILQENGGQAAAFNAGFAIAQGEIVAFLDSDDWWKPEKLAAIVKWHNFLDADYGVLQHQLDIWENGRIRPYKRILPVGDCFAEMQNSSELDFFVPTSGLCFRKKILDQIFPVPVKFNISADAYLMRTAIVFGKLYSIPEVLSFYRKHNNLVFENKNKDKMFISQKLVPELNRFYNAAGINYQFDYEKNKYMELKNKLNESEVILNSRKKMLKKIIKDTIKTIPFMSTLLMLRNYAQNAKAGKYSKYEFGRQVKLYRKDKEFVELSRSFNYFNNLKGKFKGQRCFVIGNGPSINTQDLTLLKNEITIGSNYIYRNYDNMGFYPTFLTIVNFLVAEQRAEEINNLTESIKVFPFFLRYCMEPSENTFFLNSIAVKEFSKDILDFISWQSTVTFFNLQLAYFLGFDKVYLIGVDNSYKQPDKGTEGALIKEDKDDINHFSKDYFRGLTWQKADTDAMEYVYTLAGKAFQEDGREIINAGAGGNLEVFRRAAYEELFRDDAKPDPGSFQLLKSGGSESGNDIVISVNPSLKSSYGHWLHYDLKIKDFLNKKQVGFYSFANLLLTKDILTKYNRSFLPIFSLESFFSKKYRVNFFKRKIFEDELVASIRLVQKAHPGKKIKIIFYMGSISVLPVLQKTLKKLKDVEFHVNLFWEHFNLDELELNKKAIVKIMKNIDHAAIKVFVDTEELKELFKQKLDVEYFVWPMFSISNFTLSPEDERILAGKVLDENNIKITFPGNSRIDKGFGLTLDYLESLSELDKSRFGVTIRDAGREDKLYDKRLDALKNNKSWLRVLEGTIDEDGYQDLFYYSDIIVIPYTLKSFKTRTSAVLCDSIIMQKPVIAVKGTWMGNQIEKYNIGRTIQDDSVEELQAAITEIIKNYKLYKNNIADIKNTWLEEHNINHFMKSVLQIY